MVKNAAQEQGDSFGKLHKTKATADMPSDKSNNDTLKRNIERLGYEKQMTDVIKQKQAEKLAKPIAAR